MKNIAISITLFVFFITPINLCATEDEDILKIKIQFKVWQQILNKEQLKTKNIFHIYYGENYKNEKWVTELNKDDETFVGEEVTFIDHKTMGVKFNMTETSPSGDWYIYSEHYYWPSGNIFFVFWSMKTTYADEPLTVERRLYFNEKGDVLRSLEDVYKTGTKTKIATSNYLDKKIQYWLKINELPFKNLVKK